MAASVFIDMGDSAGSNIMCSSDQKLVPPEDNDFLYF